MAKEEEGLVLKLESILMEYNDKVILEKTLNDEDEDSQIDNLKITELKYDFSAQLLIRENAIDDLVVRV